MKKAMLVLVILIINLIFTSCKMVDDNSQRYSEIQTEYIAGSTMMQGVELDSIETICEYSNTIVKATYCGVEEFDESTSIFIFEVEEDYTGLNQEECIHVYESKYNSYVEGKNYYLFLYGYRSACYPHVVYSRIRADFLVGESIDTGEYTFYDDISLNAGDIENFSTYINEEIVSKDAYMTDISDIVPDSAETLCEKADAIILVTVKTEKIGILQLMYVRLLLTKF